LLHLADLHLGAAVTPRLQELDATAAASLDRSRQQLLWRLADWVSLPASRVGLVVIAGDLFHHHAPPQELADRTRQALARMAAVVPVITVPGNHDEYSYANCVYRQGSWPGRLVTETQPSVVWEGELESGCRVCVSGVAYEAGKLPPGGTPAFPQPDDGRLGIAVVHGTVRDHYREAVVEGERCFRVSHAQAAEAGYRYLALGHVHTSREWTIGPCTAVYPGPPVGPGPSDPGTGSVLMVVPGPGGVVLRRVDDAELLGPRWHAEAVRPEPGEKPKDLADRLLPRLPADPGRIVALTLRGSVDRENYAAELQQAFLEAGRAVLVEAESLSIAAPPDVDALAQEQTLTGEFVRLWREWKQSDQPKEAHALRVLHEGLAALGRH